MAWGNVRYQYCWCTPVRGKRLSMALSVCRQSSALYRAAFPFRGEPAWSPPSKPVRARVAGGATDAVAGGATGAIAGGATGAVATGCTRAPRRPGCGPGAAGLLPATAPSRRRPALILPHRRPARRREIGDVEADDVAVGIGARGLGRLLHLRPLDGSLAESPRLCPKLSNCSTVRTSSSSGAHRPEQRDPPHEEEHRALLLPGDEDHRRDVDARQAAEHAEQRVVREVAERRAAREDAPVHGDRQPNRERRQILVDAEVLHDCVEV